jgi:predicted MPP superfamily phosphohydrolase
MGVHVVPGIRDERLGGDEWRRALARQDVLSDLSNRHVMLEKLGARLCLAGLADSGSAARGLTLPPYDERDFTILLSQSKTRAESARHVEDGVDLILCGRGGQVAVPWNRPGSEGTHYPSVSASSPRARRWTQVIASRGIGMRGVPVRLGARPEVSILDLSSAPTPREPHVQAAYLRRVVPS